MRPGLRSPILAFWVRLRLRLVRLRFDTFADRSEGPRFVVSAADLVVRRMRVTASRRNRFRF